MEAPPQPEQAAGEAHAETSQRRSSSRAARPAAGSLNVASLEQRYVSNDVFGGRRKAGQPRESLYVKGSEPENVVEITGASRPPSFRPNETRPRACLARLLSHRLLNYVYVCIWAQRLRASAQSHAQIIALTHP